MFQSSHQLTFSFQMLFLCYLLFVISTGAFGFDMRSEQQKYTANILLKSGHSDPRPPVILIPGMIASRLVSWKQKKCYNSVIEIQDIVWLNLKNMVETITYDKHCWLDCLKLENNGSDPIDCKLRPDEGLGGIGELSPGSVFASTSIYTPLIKLMSKELGYDANNIIGMPYDWRLAPSLMESRDSFFTTLKFKIQSSVRRHGRPCVVIAFSMGNLLFQYFITWLEIVDKPRGGHIHWLRKHIWGYVGYSAPLLGAPMAVKSVISGHPFGLPISDPQARELLLTCPSTHYLNPQGGGFEPIVSISGVCATSSNSTEKHSHPTDDTATCDANITNTEPLKPPCNGTKTFTVADVESGDIFSWLGAQYPDSQLSAKHQVLLDLYRNDPVFMKVSTPFRRPPIRHVMMIYGVDVPTEVGYSYAVQNVSTAPITPVSALPEWMTSAFNNYTFPTVADPFVEQQDTPLVLQETLMEDSSCLVAIHKRNARVIRDCTPDATTLSTEENANSFFTTAKVPCTPSTVAETESSTGSCKAEIFAVRSTVATSSPLDFIAGNTQNTRRVVNSDSQKMANHSGDGTVPYASLSHARKWLDRDYCPDCEDFLGAEFNWRYNGSASWSDQDESGTNRQKVTSEDMQTMKERVDDFKDILSDRDKATDSATTKDASEENIVSGNTITNNKSSGEVLTPSGDKRWRESRPARIHKHFLDDWGAPEEVLSVVSTSDPAVDLLYSVHTNGDTTTVVEVSGIDHPEVLKNAYVHEVMFRELLEKMSQDLRLQQ